MDGNERKVGKEMRKKKSWKRERKGINQDNWKKV